MSRILYCRFYEPEVVLWACAHVLGIFCVPFLTSLLWWWILLSVSEHCVYKRNLMFEGFISEHVILCETNGYFLWIWMTALHLTFVCFCVCAGWPFRWISLILTACPWRTMMHCDWLQYASRKRRDSRSREDSSTARWTSTGPSYPLLKPAVLITLSLTLSSWLYSETENTRVIWVPQLN